MLNPIYNFTARALVVLHGLLAHVLGRSGWAWALAIVLLVLGYRIALIPVFIKQVKSQRALQVMQPKMKEIKERYKHDKQRMNEEMLKLQREHGNPLLGCLPTVLQFPLFISLFRVINGFGPKGSGAYTPRHLDGLTVAQASQIAHARIFGVSLAAAFQSSAHALHELASPRLGTRALSLVLMVIMAATTYLTQRQIVGRQPAADAQAAQQQKLFLYLAPVMLFGSGFFFPVGVLLYWFTTNVWSLGQQYVILSKMPPLDPTGAPLPKPAPNKLLARFRPAPAVAGLAGGAPAAPLRQTRGGARSDATPAAPPTVPGAPGAPGAPNAPGGSVSGAAASPLGGSALPAADSRVARPGGRPANRPPAKRRTSKNRRGGRR